VHGGCQAAAATVEAPQYQEIVENRATPSGAVSISSRAVD